MKPHVCPKCDGKKKIQGDDCPTCEGKGVVWETTAADVMGWTSHRPLEPLQKANCNVHPESTKSELPSDVRGSDGEES